MIISVAGYKGGIGKTTTAIHLAAILSKNAPTLLIDADPNRSAGVWARNGKLPFTVAPEKEATRIYREISPEHTVIDTQASPSPEELLDISKGCDLLILPTTVRALDFDALVQTVEKIISTGGAYKVLLIMIPPNSSRKSGEVIDILQGANIPVFKSVIYKYSFIEQLPLDGILVSKSNDINAKKVWKQYNQVGKEILG